MCGIFGMFSDEWRAVSMGAALQACDLMRHRGPDDSGILDCGDDGLLVNRRLAIVDLAATGHQPMQDERFVLTFNGEIYNHVELRAETQSRYPFKGQSDTEVILAAYSVWGDAAIQKLRGMFAFGLWDRHWKRLIVATDRLSIKPVLYHHANGRLVFSSEVKPIAAAGVPLKVNERRLYEYLRFGLLDHSSDTLFDGISQLRPSTFLIYQDGQITIKRYWDLVDIQEGHVDEDSIAALLEEATDLHLRGDVAPALSLSSGLDSHVLRSVIERNGQPIKSFSFCFPGTPYDECQQAIQPLLNREWTGTNITLDGFLDQLDTLTSIMEAPVGGLGIYGYWLNCKSVSEQGFKVLIDGQGSDEAFAGYRYYLTNPALQVMRAPDGTHLDSDYLTPEFSASQAHRHWPLFPDLFPDVVTNARYRDLFYLKIPKLLRFQDRAAMAWSVEVRVPYLDHVLLETLWRIPSETLLAGGKTKAILRNIAKQRYGLDMPETKLYVSSPQREWLKGPLQQAVAELLFASRLVEDGIIDGYRLASQYADYCRSEELGNSFFIWKFINLELWYRRFIRSSAVSSLEVA